MSTAELSVIACLCIMLMTSGIGRPKQRVRALNGLGPVDTRETPSLPAGQRSVTSAHARKLRFASN
jgi:hypothetical protein